MATFRNGIPAQGKSLSSYHSSSSSSISCLAQRQTQLSPSITLLAQRQAKSISFLTQKKASSYEEHEVHIRVLSGVFKLPYGAEVDMNHIITVPSATPQCFTVPVLTRGSDGKYKTLTEVVEMPMALAGTVQGIKPRKTLFGLEIAELSALGEKCFEAYAIDNKLDWEFVRYREKGGKVYKINGINFLIANELSVVLDIKEAPAQNINRQSLLLANKDSISRSSSRSSSGSVCSAVVNMASPSSYSSGSRHYSKFRKRRRVTRSSSPSVISVANQARDSKSKRESLTSDESEEYFLDSDFIADTESDISESDVVSESSSEMSSDDSETSEESDIWVESSSNNDQSSDGGLEESEAEDYIDDASDGSNSIDTISTMEPSSAESEESDRD